MIEIKKGDPPDVLLVKQNEAREKDLSPKESYQLLKNDRPARDYVRESLIEEQSGLCAYCMRRIHKERTFTTNKRVEIARIEHWIPLTYPNVGQGLDYSNLLAVCSGNEGKETKKHNKKSALTCDAKRGASPLKVNPCDPSTLCGVQYSSKGIISSSDPEIDADLRIRLGLNCSVDVFDLPKLRKGALDGLLRTLKKKLESESMSELRKYCANMLTELKNDKLKVPYVGVVIWRLQEFLKNTNK